MKVRVLFLAARKVPKEPARAAWPPASLAQTPFLARASEYFINFFDNKKLILKKSVIFMSKKFTLRASRLGRICCVASCSQ